MGLKIGGSVERVNGKDLSYDEFVERFMAKNEPVILSGLMEDWRACRDWVLEDGKPNLQFFSTNFGNSRVQVAECGTKDFTDQKRFEMSVSEFIDHWLETSAVEGSCFSTTDFKSRPLLYLKDWHFVTEYPEYSAYMTPLLFRDDWLNLYLDQYHMHTDPSSYQEANEISCSDYRFVYMGTKGTWTPLHADVFRSYSWSANVCGKKQWYFLSPGQQHLIFDRYKKHSVYDIFEEVTKEKFPGFKEAMWLECMQGQNEIIFVPSGWYHQVHNLEDTISINHNWFNGYNLQWVWDLLLRDYNEAKEYIEDVKDFCDDFEGLCQRNLAANTGMNFYDFFIFVVRVSYVNMVQLYHLAQINSCKMWSSSQRARHIIFNLQSLKSIGLKMKSTCLAKNDTVSTDILKASDDPTILELCTQLQRTYMIIHNKCEVSNETEDNLADGSGDMGLCELPSSLIRTPQDLVNFVDRALLNLGIYPPKMTMVSGID